MFRRIGISDVKSTCGLNDKVCKSKSRNCHNRVIMTNGSETREVPRFGSVCDVLSFKAYETKTKQNAQQLRRGGYACKKKCYAEPLVFRVVQVDWNLALHIAADEFGYDQIPSLQRDNFLERVRNIYAQIRRQKSGEEVAEVPVFPADKPDVNAQIVAELRVRLRNCEERNATLEEALPRLVGRLTELDQELSRSQEASGGGLREERQQLDFLRAELSNASIALQQMEQERERIQKGYDQDVAGLQEQILVLQQAYREAEQRGQSAEQLSLQRQEIETLQQQIAEQRAQVDARTQELETRSAFFERLRTDLEQQVQEIDSRMRELYDRESRVIAAEERIAQEQQQQSQSLLTSLFSAFRWQKPIERIRNDRVEVLSEEELPELPRENVEESLASQMNLPLVPSRIPTAPISPPLLLPTGYRPLLPQNKILRPQHLLLQDEQLELDENVSRQIQIARQAENEAESRRRLTEQEVAKNRIALALQARQRGKQTRQQLQQMKTAATQFQSLYRGRKARLNAAALRRLQAAERLKALIRGRQLRKALPEIRRQKVCRDIYTQLSLRSASMSNLAALYADENYDQITQSFGQEIANLLKQFTNPAVANQCIQSLSQQYESLAGSELESGSESESEEEVMPSGGAGAGTVGGSMSRLPPVEEQYLNDAKAYRSLDLTHTLRKLEKNVGDLLLGNTFLFSKENYPITHYNLKLQVLKRYRQDQILRTAAYNLDSSRQTELDEGLRRDQTLDQEYWNRLERLQQKDIPNLLKLYTAFVLLKGIIDWKSKQKGGLFSRLPNPAKLKKLKSILSEFLPGVDVDRVIQNIEEDPKLKSKLTKTLQTIFELLQSHLGTQQLDVNCPRMLREKFRREDVKQVFPEDDEVYDILKMCKP